MTRERPWLRSRGARWAMLAVVIAGLFVVANILDRQISTYPPIAKYRGVQLVVGPGEKYQPGGWAMVLQLGGLRGLAANMLWMETDAIWHSGDWYKMLPMMRVILKLDPHFIDVWQTFGWHLAWNINAAAKEQVDKDRREYERVQQQLAGLIRAQKAGQPVAPEDIADGKAALSTLGKKVKEDDAIARSWIQRGIELDEEGIKQNPNRWEMYWELAWLYYDRTREWDEAEKALLRLLSKVKIFDEEAKRRKTQPVPFWVYHTMAHLYEKTLQVDKAIHWFKIAYKLKDNPQRQVAKSALEWWAVHKNDPNEYIRIMKRERQARVNRGLPLWKYPAKYEQLLRERGHLVPEEGATTTPPAKEPPVPARSH